VLGAGASKPYGLPLGSKLRTLICDAQNQDNPAARAITQYGVFGFTHDDIRHVARTFLRSGVGSIDEFLGRQPHFVDVGKALIAAILCSKENLDEIFSEQNPDHWYRLLWSALTDGTMQGQDLGRNGVRFITFNYDRSLEFFLHESTKSTYGYNDAAAYGLWSPNKPATRAGRCRRTKPRRSGACVKADTCYAASCNHLRRPTQPIRPRPKPMLAVSLSRTMVGGSKLATVGRPNRGRLRKRAFHVSAD